MADEITLTIDGVEVKATPGSNILQAAMDAGLYVPYLCYYPGMKSFGACRMCLVEVEGGRGAPASCTTPVADGMVVKTKTPEVVKLRKGIIELVISEHPHGCLNCHRIDLCGPEDICQRHVSVKDRCVTCPKNERCELKDTVRHMELDMDTPLTYNNRHLPLAVNDPFWDMDMNLCIVCGRCVRVCDEVRGDNALGFLQRAGQSLIGTSHGTSLLESGCEFCGACIDVCPTGALVERTHKWDKAVTTVESVCPHCPVGCSLKLEVNKRNRVIRAIPNRHAEANRGQGCFKGKFGLGFVNNGKRLKRPQIRTDGELREVPWHEALDYVAENMARYRDGRYAMIASPRGTNEDNYVAQKFARTVMGTNNVDLSSNIRPELTKPLGKLLGYEAATNPIWDLEEAGCVLVVSSNVTEEQNVAGVPVKRAAKAGAKVIVIDQRETELTRYASMWLRPRPGSEQALIGGMVKVIVDEALDDHDFIADRCDDVAALKSSLWNFDLLKVEQITAIPQDEIQDAARLFAATKPAAILYALETVRPELRNACVTALVNLALVTGNIGRPSTGLYPLFPGANEQGSKDVGCAPDLLPGYRSPADPAAIERFGEAWGVELPEGAGIGIRESADAIREGKIKALHVIGDNPNFDNGELEDFVQALKQLEFFVVHDNAASVLTDFADVVLPASTFAEKNGTFTNMERRVQRLRPAIGPKGEEEPDWRILSQVATAMGGEGFGYETAEQVLDEINGLVDQYGGITYQRLEQAGLQWPCLAPDMVDTPMLYSETSDGSRPRMEAMEMIDPPPHADTGRPFLLARGRVLHDGEREVDIARNNGRNRIQRDEVVEVHEQDASSLGVSEGDIVDVVGARNRIRGVARFTSPHPGLVCVTSLFGDLAVDLDASSDNDPMFRVPGLPLEPVRMERVETAAEVAAAD